MQTLDELFERAAQIGIINVYQDDSQKSFIVTLTRRNGNTKFEAKSNFSKTLKEALISAIDSAENLLKEIK